ncbi:MAG: DNA cytosine methyltransferase, partial [Coprobacillaceae bacterium]
ERKRVIIVGVNKETEFTVEEFYESIDSQRKTKIKKTVRDAIEYLPKFKPLKEPYKNGRKNVSHELIGDLEITHHITRYNNKRDIDVFKYWLSDSMNSAPYDEKIEFYKKITGKTTKHNKYRSLEWDKPSPTVVSHLYKDGLMFIHPDIKQLRSITVREAALLQSFPKDYVFIGSDSYCYKMIGNAVPVLFAKSIALALIEVLEKNK